jgi:sterol desaturase/sphingolipid hydroxylase (fatty acid hydroxylase superfamily)
MGAERAVVLVMLAVNCLALCLVEGRRPRPATDVAGRGRHLGPNLVLTVLLIGTNVALDLAARAAGVREWSLGPGLLGAPGLPGWAKVVLVVVVLDALAYLAHVLLHKLPFAWRIHRVHHSDADVDVTTAFRQHPLETIWRYGFQLAGVLVLGASTRSVAVYLGLSAVNAQLEHARVAWPASLERRLRVLLATPAMHRVHHSRAQAETDTNYSNILSAWDRLFGTYRAPRPGERIAYGLDGMDGAAQQQTAGLLALPFGEARRS